MMSISMPSNLYLNCSKCQEETMCHVLKEGKASKKLGTIDILVECNQCKAVFHAILPLEKEVELPVVLSNGQSSKRLRYPIPEDEELAVGDEFMLDDLRVKITRIEKGESRVTRLPAKEISTLWVKKYDRIALKLSVVDKDVTSSRKVWATPEEEFAIGDIIESRGESSVVYAIKTTDSKLRRGFAQAGDILRIYAKPLKNSKRRH